VPGDESYEQLRIASMAAVHRDLSGWLFMTIKAYYDGSGKVSTPNGSHIALAGFCGSEAAWSRLEDLWQDEILTRFDIPYVHMKEAYHLQPPHFGEDRGWSMDRVDELRNAVLDSLYKAISEFRGDFAGTCCVLNLADYARACAERPDLLKEREAFCVDWCVTTALRMRHDQNGNLREEHKSLQLLFDQGEAFFHKINRVWQRRKKDRRTIFPLIDVLSPVADGKKVPAIQAADFIGWHARRFYSNGDAMAEFYAAPFFLVHHQYLDYEAIIQRHKELLARSSQ
jgi:hypothetical protein